MRTGSISKKFQGQTKKADMVADLKNLVGGDNLWHVFEVMNYVIDPSSTDAFNELTLLKGRFNELKRRARYGIINRDDLNVEFTKLRYDLLAFIDELDFEGQQLELPDTLILRHALEDLNNTNIQDDRQQKAIEKLELQYNDLLRRDIQESINREEYQSQVPQILREVKIISERLDSNKLSHLGSDEVITCPILVLASHDSRVGELKSLFQKFPFSNVTFSIWGSRPGFDYFDIIVFDNTDLMGEKEAEESFLKMEQRTMRQDRELQMDYCIVNSRAYLLHYGNNLSWLEAHRARAHAANSKFALYARLKELVDFINAYEV